MQPHVLVEGIPLFRTAETRRVFIHAQLKLLELIEHERVVNMNFDALMDMRRCVWFGGRSLPRFSRCSVRTPSFINIASQLEHGDILTTTQPPFDAPHAAQRVDIFIGSFHPIGYLSTVITDV